MVAPLRRRGEGEVMGDIVKIGCGFALGKAMPALAFIALVVLAVLGFLACVYTWAAWDWVKRKLRKP